MGKRRFAGTLSSNEHRTDTSKYASNLTAWIRGWEYGVEIETKDWNGQDAFEIYACGGSNPGKSEGRKLIGTIVGGEFKNV